MIHKNDIKQLITNKFSYSDFNKFFSFCVNYGQYHLQNIPYFIKICASYSVKEITISLLGPLFARNKSGEFFRLKHYFNKLDKSVDELTDGECMYLLKSLIRKCLKQNMSVFLEEADPEYAKILRNVKRYLKASTKIFLHDGYVIFNGETTGNDSGVDLFQEIRNRFLGTPVGDYSTGEMVDNLIQIAKTCSPPIDSLELNKVIILIKEKRRLVYEKKNEENLASIVDRSVSLQHVYKWLEDLLRKKYVEKQKLSPEEAARTGKAVINFLTDLTQYGSTKNLYEYMEEKFPELTESDYKKNYKNRFEYFIRLAQDKMAEYLKEEI